MTQFIDSILVPVLYLLSAVLFILGIKGLTRVRTAQRGNALAALAMLIAIVTTLLHLGLVDFRWIIAGLIIGGLIGGIAAMRVEMTAMPEMVALFNGFGGGASALVASSIIWLEVVEPGFENTPASVMGGDSALTAFLSIFIGAGTLSGSLIAFLKLKGTMTGSPILIPGRHVVNGLLLVGTAAIDMAKSGAPAAAVGLVNFMGYMGAFAGDQATGMLVDHHGWSAALGFWAGCAIGGAAIAALLWKRGPVS